MILLRAVTALSLLTTLAAALGLLLWRRWPAFRGPALLLAWAPVHDVAQWLLGRALLGEPVPYVGRAAAAFHVQAALLVSWPFAVLGVAVALFLRRRPWSVALAWVVASAAMALAYPELRERPRWYAYAAITAGCCLATWIAAAVDYARAYRELRDWGGLQLVVIMLSVGAAVSVPVYLSADPVAAWGSARAIQGTAFAIVSAYLATALWRRHRS